MGETRETLADTCPGPDCPYCAGESCRKCGPGPTLCDHDSIERHELPKMVLCAKEGVSKTPETDAEWERSREKRIYDLFAPEYMMRDLAKKLELERDQFRRQVEVLAEEPPKFVKS